MGWVMQRAIDEQDRIDRAAAKQVVRRTAAFLKPHRSRTVAAIAVMIGSTLTTIAGPLLIRAGIDKGVRGHSRAALDRAALAYIVTVLLGFVFGRAQVLLVGQVGEGFLRDLRLKVFAHLQRLPMAFHDREPTGKLVSRMTSDIDALTDLVQIGLVAFVTNGLMITLSIVVLLSMSPLLAVASLVGFPFVVLASRRFRRRSDEAYLTLRDRIAVTMSSLQEGLSGVRVVQASAREDDVTAAFARANRAQYEANLKATRIAAEYFPVVEFAGTAATAAVLGVGGLLVHRGSVTVGTVVAFVLYLGNLFEPVQQLSQLFNTVQSSGAALKKLFGLLDEPDDLADAPGALALPERGAIEVRNATFTYQNTDAKVLDGVNLTIAAGERIALVGPTGAGKSTLAKLIARLYDPTAGTVSYGGVDLRDATHASLRERMVVVPQEGYLFTGRLADNVRVGRPAASDTEVEKALSSIGVLEHFERFPEGLATEVNERGSRLSAGERQLVSLARAALADPEVLVLDEATSSLDPGTEAEVEAALEALMTGRTVIVIAHRLSTSERADRVGVVVDGQIAELGTHAELLDAGGLYTGLYRSWTRNQRA
jgi:ATP-binding cassette, subfamily B, bacterial